MVGPSSSHTAGAVRLGLASLALLGEPPDRAVIGLHGSFAATGHGHATDRALLAGILGFAPDDARLPDSTAFARSAGLEFAFQLEDLGDASHPNSARIQLFTPERSVDVIGASLGGGLVEIVRIDGYPTSYRANMATLIFWHTDERGFLAKVTTLLASAHANIATLRTTRQRKGDRALTLIETDSAVPTETLHLMRRIHGIATLRHLAPLP